MTAVREEDILVALIAETERTVVRVREWLLQAQLERRAIQVVIEKSRGLMAASLEGRVILART